MASKYIVITGISSGIGKYLAHLLIDHGFQVIGTHRDPDALQVDFFSEFGSIPLYMDMANEESIVQAAIRIQEITGNEGLYGLINNAGLAIPGPLAEVPIEKFKYQFQVNVFGNLLLIQKLIPLLQLQGGSSRILNIGSVSGLFASPFLGSYAASKFALEGLSDSLRRELQLIGIRVILIEPGPIRTSIWKKNLDVAEDYKDGSFQQYLEKATEVILQMEKNAMPLEVLNKPILHALVSTKPKARYLIHKNKFLFLLLAKILPDKWADYLVYKNLKSNNNKLRPV